MVHGVQDSATEIHRETGRRLLEGVQEQLDAVIDIIEAYKVGERAVASVACRGLEYKTRHHLRTSYFARDSLLVFVSNGVLHSRRLIGFGWTI